MLTLRKSAKSVPSADLTSFGLPQASFTALLAAVFVLTSVNVRAQTVDYEREIKPVLKARCYACHGALQQKAGLRVDTGEALRRGGDDGGVIDADQPADSRLLARVTAADPSERMPPDGPPLTSEQVARLRAWIANGAQSPADEAAEADPRQHWAFQPPVRVTPSETSASHPIDAFVEARLVAAGLSPQPPADKATWLRRVTLDLIGVPPTLAELNAFAADESPAACEQVVDRLLADPRYGERWGRHWMDVWRYADWHGRRHVPDVWNSAPQVWRWRDWIVESLNEDHGYDRMVREMLAADEVCPEDSSAGVATGYLIRNWYALNPNDWMRANVEHVSKAFLGLTFHCAHCHNHKYDPIAQDDYFRLRAYFEPIGIRQDRMPGEADPGPFQEYEYSTLRKVQRLGAVRIFDKTPAAPTWFYTGGDERNRVADRGSMTPAMPAFLGVPTASIETISLPPASWYPGSRPELQEGLLAEQRAAVTAADAALVTARAESETGLAELRTALSTAETEYDAVLVAARERGGGALAGRQSLVLDATQGRRTVQHGLNGLKALPDGTTVAFQLQLVQDAHSNFQLAKDLGKGLTAAYVGFEKGRILSYQPGGTTEFTAGQYDTAGPRRFVVTWMLEPSADRGLLSVHAVGEGPPLVDRVPVALNGWKPAQGMLFDARPGSLAVIDDLCWTIPATESVAAVTILFDFEPPTYPDQTDIVGRDGWQASFISSATGTSHATSVVGDATLAKAAQQRRRALQAVAARELLVTAADARRTAAESQLAGLTARIAADRAKFARTVDADELTRAASRAHRQAAWHSAEAARLSAERVLAVAEAKPLDDAKRAKEIETATKSLNAARTAVEQARQKLDDANQDASYPPLTPVYPETSTGRRRALVEWITDRRHPLTARVAVNHIWLRHFHAPLVATVFDFGRNGARPTHPELLDWLAVELMESDWSQKHLHRLIVTSEAYARSSRADDEGAKTIDPENALLWRMNVGRMEAEVVRDSLLFVAGRLDDAQCGQELENDKALTTYRRSLYYSCQPETDGKSTFGALFDAPEPNDCYRRTRSVVPQQSLALTNSDLIHELSGPLAEALRQTSHPSEFIATAFVSLLARPPTAAESAACAEFLSTPAGTADDETAAARRRAGLIRALLNHNDFIAIR